MTRASQAEGDNEEMRLAQPSIPTRPTYNRNTTTFYSPDLAESSPIDEEDNSAIITKILSPVEDRQSSPDSCTTPLVLTDRDSSKAIQKKVFQVCIPRNEHSKNTTTKKSPPSSSSKQVFRIPRIPVPHYSSEDYSNLLNYSFSERFQIELPKNLKSPLITLSSNIIQRGNDTTITSLIKIDEKAEINEDIPNDEIEVQPLTTDAEYAVPSTTQVTKRSFPLRLKESLYRAIRGVKVQNTTKPIKIIRRLVRTSRSPVNAKNRESKEGFYPYCP